MLFHVQVSLFILLQMYLLQEHYQWGPIKIVLQYIVYNIHNIDSWEDRGGLCSVTAVYI
jgi:hypothetical protein